MYYEIHFEGDETCDTLGIHSSFAAKVLVRDLMDDPAITLINVEIKKDESNE